MLIDDGLNAFETFIDGKYAWFSNYNYDSYYYIYFFLLRCFYELFGMHHLPWFLLFSFLQALNVSVYFYFSLLFFQKIAWQKKQSLLAAMATSLLFLFSPYNSENIIWAATLHYNISFLCLFICLIQLFLYANKVQEWTKHLFFFYITFIISLFTFELSLFYPFIFIALVFLLKRTLATQLKKTMLYFSIIPLLFSIAYIFFLYYQKHTWVPHAQQSLLQHFRLIHTVEVGIQHWLKIIFGIHFLSFPWRDAFYQYSISPVGIGIFFFLLLVIFLLVYKKNKKIFPYFIFILFASAICTAPFALRSFSTLFRYENMRYSYFSSAFLFLAITFFIFLLKKEIRYFILLLYLVFFLYTDVITINDKIKSGQVFENVIQHFPRIEKDTKYYLLNIPSYASETYLFWSDNRLAIALKCFTKKQFDYNNIIPIMNYCSQGIHDSFKVKKINDSSYEFRLLSPGAWLMKGYLGALSYENEKYRCEIGEWGNYQLTFKKNLEANEKLYYFNGKTFIAL